MEAGVTAFKSAKKRYTKFGAYIQDKEIITAIEAELNEYEEIKEEKAERKNTNLARLFDPFFLATFFKIFTPLLNSSISSSNSFSFLFLLAENQAKTATKIIECTESGRPFEVDTPPTEEYIKLLNEQGVKESQSESAGSGDIIKNFNDMNINELVIEPENTGNIIESNENEINI